jgi:hypothetical protein
MEIELIALDELEILEEPVAPDSGWVRITGLYEG